MVVQELSGLDEILVVVVVEAAHFEVVPLRKLRIISLFSIENSQFFHV